MPLATVHELPDAFMPLGAAAAGLAARRAAAAHPDVAVIDLAGRVKRLEMRNRRVLARRHRLHLSVEAAHPSPMRTRAATRAEFQAGQARRKPMEGEIGLTRPNRVGRRMTGRLVRWVSRLAAMEPQTIAELGAKASAFLIVGSGSV